MNETRPLSYGWRIILLLAILAGVALRPSNLRGKIFWFDEVFTAVRIAGYDEHDEIIPALYTGQIVRAGDIQRYQVLTDRSVIETVRGLARKEPQQPPFYFILARMAVRLTDDMIMGTRGVSLIFGIAGLLAIYWLALELFREQSAAWFAAAITAVSPFFIRYAQEARPYSLWVFLIMISGALLLRAVRKPSLLQWSAYTAATTLMLYTHTLSVLVLAGFGIYLLLTERTLKNRTVSGFFLASGASFLAFLPWIAIMIIKRDLLITIAGYLGAARPFSVLLKAWSLQLSRILTAWPEPADERMILLTIPTIVLLGIALVYLVRHSKIRVWLFILLMAVILPLAVVLPDLVLGGWRSLQARYTFPALIALILALAFLLAKKTQQPNRVRAKIWSLLTLLILLVGLVSSAASIRASTWWGLSQVDLDMLEIFNAHPGALIITDSVYGVVAPLSYRLDPDMAFILARHPFSLAIPEGYDPIYVYQPGAELAGYLQGQPNSALKLSYQRARRDGTVYHLYELVRE